MKAMFVLLGYEPQPPGELGKQHALVSQSVTDADFSKEKKGKKIIIRDT